jgi:hypothetical protein
MPATIEKGDYMSVIILSTFKGYTVDLRRREFRRAIPETVLEFIPFDSPKGKELFGELKSFAVEILAIPVFQVNRFGSVAW